LAYPNARGVSLGETYGGSLESDQQRPGDVSGTDLLGRATRVVRRLTEETLWSYWTAALRYASRMPGAPRKLSRIAHAADSEQLADYLAEIGFALIFAALGFTVEIEPLGNKGPDLRISRDGRSSMVEVLRFKHVYPGPPEFKETDLFLASYGNTRRDSLKALQKMQDKFRQLASGDSFLAIWNDDGDMEEADVLTAAHMLRDDTEAGILQLPPGLAFILYGSAWVRSSNNQQLYCFPLRRRLPDHQTQWMSELEHLRVNVAVCRLIGYP